MNVYDLDGEALSLDKDTGELHRDGETASERQPLAVNSRLTAGLRGSVHGGEKGLDCLGEASPPDKSLVAPTLEVLTSQHKI